ncbi:MAG: gliding motility-associated protein GldE [Prevotella sp.]|nr:gliding motility-associated protein GldE [Bacteroides sp.]MCM1366820.1 gliding motility-associated protein GldE [Prevotella sp.]MCM1437401.1 gliding motility-associated protein GldE [Prevotella sp.]
MILLADAISFHAPESLSWFAWGAIVAIAFCCLLLSAFVSGSEIAFFGLTKSEIDDLRDDEENSRSRQAYNLVAHSEQLLATILISNNLVNITMVVLLTFAINSTITFTNTVMEFLLQTVFLTFLLLLFGEIFPKLLARGKTLQWVQFAAPGVNFLYHIFSPLSRFMVKSTGIINRIVAKKDVSISTDELEKALEISDVQEGKDKEMLEGILSFGEKEVSDIMISRVDVTAIEFHDKWSDVLKVILESGFSRIPVYDTSQDSIRGILYAKDLLPYFDKADDNFEWQSLLREPYFVPESRMIDDLLEDFRKRKIHIAIVIDEYGGTRGIVTLEDIIEEIVGEIDDEYDDNASMYKKIGPDTYIFDAKINLPDFCRITGVDEEEIEQYAGDAETLAGLLLSIKGDFPARKEALSCGRCKFLVLRIERHRITSVRVNIEPENSQSQENGD